MKVIPLDPDRPRRRGQDEPARRQRIGPDGAARAIRRTATLLLDVADAFDRAAAGSPSWIQNAEIVIPQLEEVIEWASMSVEGLKGGPPAS